MRFPGFEGEWEVKKLGDVFNISAGGDIKKENVRQFRDEKFQFPIYANAEKNDGLYGYSDLYKIEENAITIAGRGINIGITHVRDHKFYPIVRLLVLKSLNKENLTFFMYQINRINLFKESTGVPQLTAPQISGYEVYYPKVSEQQKIASYLSLMDKRIQTQNKIIEELESLKLTLLNKLFIREIRFKDENGNNFPDWKEKKLEEIFYSEKGKGISKNKITQNGKYRCILYGELYTKYNEVIFEVESKTDTKDGIKSKVGDLLIPSSTTTTGIDLANVTALNEENILLGGDITILRSNEKMSNIFYAYYLSNHKKEEIASYAQGSTIVHLYYSHIKNMKIDFPCFEEQNKIANFLLSIDEKIIIKTRLLQQMQNQKKYLLQNLFT